MGDIKPFKQEKLIIGILSTVSDIDEKLVSQLSDNFGKIDYKSSIIPFTFTDYYLPEMGPAINRYFLSFKSLVFPDKLSEIKILTNQIEKIFMVNSNRKINIDPGLISLKRLILATTKDNGHRIPLSKGIYGEVTLLFMKKQFTELPWTYADYKTQEYKEIFIKIRERYKLQLKNRESADFRILDR